jgi:Predicted transcriptional regulators
MNISEVSQKYNVSKDTLRYYEKIGLLKPIAKNKSGMRDYTEKDCIRLEEVLFYRSADVSIEKLKMYIDLFEKGDSTLEQRRTILENYIIHLEEEQKRIGKLIEIIKGKIKLYDKLIEDYNKKKSKK